MNEVALFLLGTGVTLLVGLAVALLAWAAVMDGRYEREFRAELVQVEAEVVPLYTRPAVAPEKTTTKGAA